jgi:hypothetical protein
LSSHNTNKNYWQAVKQQSNRRRSNSNSNINSNSNSTNTADTSSDEMKPLSVRSQQTEPDVETLTALNEEPKPTLSAAATAASSGKTAKVTKKSTVTKQPLVDQVEFQFSPSTSLSSSTSLSLSTSFNSRPVYGNIGNNNSSNIRNNDVSNNNNIPRRVFQRVDLMKHLLVEMRVAEKECWKDDDDD